MIKAEQGYYVNFEIDTFLVKNNTCTKNYFYDFSKLLGNHFSLREETTYHSSMEEICNLNRSKNLIKIPITITKSGQFQAQEKTCWFSF